MPIARDRFRFLPGDTAVIGLAGRVGLRGAKRGIYTSVTQAVGRRPGGQARVAERRATALCWLEAAAAAATGKHQRRYPAPRETLPRLVASSGTPRLRTAILRVLRAPRPARSQPPELEQEVPGPGTATIAVSRGRERQRGWCLGPRPSLMHAADARRPGRLSLRAASGLQPARGHKKRGPAGR